jgi:hypothetical protein
MFQISSRTSYILAQIGIFTTYVKKYVKNFSIKIQEKLGPKLLRIDTMESWPTWKIWKILINLL